MILICLFGGITIGLCIGVVVGKDHFKQERKELHSEIAKQSAYYDDLVSSEDENRDLKKKINTLANYCSDLLDRNRRIESILKEGESSEKENSFLPSVAGITLAHKSNVGVPVYLDDEGLLRECSTGAIVIPEGD